VLESMRKDIHGMVHCSGGGQTKVMHFIDNLHVIKDTMFPVPPLFRIIQEQSGTYWQEMYKVFNMGHRFEIYTNQAGAEEIIKIAAGFNLDAKVIGRCEASKIKKLTIISENGEFEY
jgi:phosphoribosylformylglycinamidine cyclo-ligase